MAPDPRKRSGKNLRASDGERDDARRAIAECARMLGYERAGDVMPFGSLQAVADHVGCSRQWVSLVWHGNRKATVDFYQRLASF